MKIGVCGTIRGKNADGTEFDLLAEARRVGFDYIELPLSSVAAMSEEEYAGLRERVQTGGLPCEACNVFFPGTLRLTGLDVDRRKIRGYLEMALERAAGLGVQVAVFGSAGARNVPELFPIRPGLDATGGYAAHGRADRGDAWNHDRDRAAQQGRKQHHPDRLGRICAGQAGRPRSSIQLLVDYYHMAKDGEDCGIIRTARKWIKHAHFADPDGRNYPHARKPNFQTFFGPLKDIGYSGRVSLEAGYQDFSREAPMALEIMRELAN